MNQQHEIYKDGEKVASGDRMHIGGRVHVVRSFKPYPEFHKVCPGRTARIAVMDTDLEITVIDGHGTRLLAEAGAA